MAKTYRVSADHVITKYGCKDALAQCSEALGGLWYASMSSYGCSKDYATPETAIRMMLADHGCYNIVIRAAG